MHKKYYKKYVLKLLCSSDSYILWPHDPNLGTKMVWPIVCLSHAYSIGLHFRIDQFIDNQHTTILFLVVFTLLEAFNNLLDYFVFCTHPLKRVLWPRLIFQKSPRPTGLSALRQPLLPPSAGTRGGNNGLAGHPLKSPRQRFPSVRGAGRKNKRSPVQVSSFHINSPTLLESYPGNEQKQDAVPVLVSQNLHGKVWIKHI